MKKGGLSIRGMIYSSVFGAVTAAGAFIMIPLPPVPITLQTMFVYLAGALLGARLGLLSQVVYLLTGIMGLPVFAGGKAGLGVLFGPTGGYLTGFVVGAYLIGKSVEMRRNPGFLWIFVSILVGTVVIYLFGVAQLSLVARLSLEKAVTVGVLPFLMGDLLKMVVATLIAVKIRDRVRIDG
ncbi:MAG: biotin transporter BioY [Deltaproteobacteria bacterium]|nr:biotin transporter BioY [Deltaproteobacteria bacterium]MBW2047507.1 biotin transporter BioY [Deltaproteobacteria bacterium]MBW2111733.1 biotin transporter BioY [Deltaproteobacteria bacterium]MBW2352098.1 biotin transporter BioY [Deltaproteobacteria bacterium]